MSLIADALRKAETTSPPAGPPAQEHRSLWLYRGLLVAGIAVVLAGLGVVGRNSGGRILPPTGGPMAAPAALPRPIDGRPALSGIIQGRDGESLAIINNEILEEGQSYRGATVTRIGQKEVELQEGEQTRTLKLRD